MGYFWFLSGKKGRGWGIVCSSLAYRVALISAGLGMHIIGAGLYVGTLIAVQCNVQCLGKPWAIDMGH